MIVNEPWPSYRLNYPSELQQRSQVTFSAALFDGTAVHLAAPRKNVGNLWGKPWENGISRISPIWGDLSIKHLGFHAGKPPKMSIDLVGKSSGIMSPRHHPSPLRTSFSSARLRSTTTAGFLLISSFNSSTNLGSAENAEFSVNHGTLNARCIIGFVGKILSGNYGFFSH